MKPVSSDYQHTIRRQKRGLEGQGVVVWGEKASIQAPVVGFGCWLQDCQDYMSAVGSLSDVLELLFL